MVSAEDFKRPWTIEKYASVELASLPTIEMENDGFKTIISARYGNEDYSMIGYSPMIGEYVSVEVDGKEVVGTERFDDPIACKLDATNGHLECATVDWKDLYPTDPEGRDITLSMVDAQERMLKDEDGLLFPDLATKHASEIGAMLSAKIDRVKEALVSKLHMPENYLIMNEGLIDWAKILFKKDAWALTPRTRNQTIEFLEKSVNGSIAEARYAVTDPTMIQAVIKFSKAFLEVTDPIAVKELINEQMAERMNRLKTRKEGTWKSMGPIVQMLKESLYWKFLPMGFPYAFLMHRNLLIDSDEKNVMNTIESIAKMDQSIAGRLPLLRGIEIEGFDFQQHAILEPFPNVQVEKVMKENPKFVSLAAKEDEMFNPIVQYRVKSKDKRSKEERKRVMEYMQLSRGETFRSREGFVTMFVKDDGWVKETKTRMEALPRRPMKKGSALFRGGKI